MAMFKFTGLTALVFKILMDGAQSKPKSCVRKKWAWATRWAYLQFQPLKW